MSDYQKNNSGQADSVDQDLNKGKQPEEQNKPDDNRVKTVVPDNDSGKPGKPQAQDSNQDSSNKDAGPSGENL
jgi:hypothetical protein